MCIRDRVDRARASARRLRAGALLPESGISGSSKQLSSRKEEVEDDAQLVQLLIGASARIVLVFVVGIELDMPSDRKDASGIQSRIAPFPVLALVEKLGADVRCRMVRTKSKCPLSLKAIAIAP